MLYPLNTIGKSLQYCWLLELRGHYFGAFLYIQNATAEKIMFGVHAASKG